ncbi:glycosyltransferase family 2 protein [Natrialba sp. INN-245]|uniref:glycosyltransferase family 2 protein n=1 Tax=Natrialba sp. INN-245 TaxID=2690967 RepID=UPI0013131F00|nr:glycosyltransferase family 2 protein [Natrialba sp. INN-245]MWV40037.1 glycosyltransferase [Natrialba sp. INN-245]
MYREHSIGVVIPAYNEEGFVGGVIREMPDYVDRLFVVDDCSTDGTWDEIREAAREDAKETELTYDDDSESEERGDPIDADEPVATDGGTSMLERRAEVHNPVGRVVPIAHRENLGAGGAIKTGYLAALEYEMDVTATVDGDGQMDLSQLPKLLDPIVEGEADYAKGNRLLYKEFRNEMPAFRFFGNSILTFLTKIASGYWKTMDPQNGYTAISGYALENVGIQGMYEYYGYCNDILVKLNAKGMRVADVAMPAVYGDEESSITYRTYIRKVSWMLLKNFLWRLKVKYLALDFHPLALFYLFGAGMATLGLLGGGWSIYAKITFGDSLFLRGTASLLMFSLGSMFVMFAMLFDMQANEHKEVQVRE